LYEWSKLAADAGLPEAGSGFRGVALGYCTRSRDEVDEVVRAAEAAGGGLLVSPRETFWGGYAGYFADPDDHVWEVAWNPGWTITESGDVLLGTPT
jgi:uncharacterized glyoxalase superfamily protein PhnB